MRQIYGTAQGRLHAVGRADSAIASAMVEFDGISWLSFDDLKGLSHGDVISTWPARVGVDASQPVNASRPLYDAVNRLALFDGVDDAMSFAVDMSHTDECSWIVSSGETGAAVIDVLFTAPSITTYLNNGALRSSGAPGTAVYDKEDMLSYYDVRAVAGGRFSNSGGADIWRVDPVFTGQITNLRTDSFAPGAGNYVAGNVFLATTSGGGAPLQGGLSEFLLFGERIPETLYRELLRHVAVKEGLL